MRLINKFRSRLINWTGAITRRFLTLGGVNKYGSIPAWTATGDFKVEVDFAAGTQLSNTAIVATELKFKLQLNTNGTLALLIGNGAGWAVNSTTVETYDDVKLHTARVTKTGTNYKLRVDEQVVIDVTTASAVTPEIDQVGKRDAVQFFSGVLANLSLTDTAGGDNRFYAMSSGSTTTEPDKLGTGTTDMTLNNIIAGDWEQMTQVGADWLGGELVVNGGFDADTDWILHASTTIADGVATAVATPAGQNPTRQNVALLDGTTYVAAYRLRAYTSGDGVRFRMGSDSNDNSGGVFKSAGFLREVIVAGSTYDQIRINVTGVAATSCIIDDVSVKRILQGPPQQDIHTLGDSFSTNSYSYQTLLKGNFNLRPGNFTYDAVGGSSLAQQKIRFDATPEFYSDVLIIMDGGLTDSSVDAISAINAIVANLTHDRWVWVQPSPEEFINGSPERTDWDARVDAIKAAVGAGHYVECLTALKAGNDGGALDLQDVADNIVPRSLRVDTIHETGIGTGIRTQQIVAFIKAKGW